MSGLDYSKWDHIEISDDEDDTHPNIDTPSLFRWRHQARVDRMEEQKQEKEKVETERLELQQKKEAMQRELRTAEEKGAVNDAVQKDMQHLHLQEKEFLRKEDEFKKKERLTPLNIDTICHDAGSRTIINKSQPRKNENLTEDERMERQRQHNEKYEKEIKKYGMLRKYEATQACLQDNLSLVCEETANYLVLWCIDLAMEKKVDLMEHVAHQTIVMQFMLELARQLDIDPRNCVSPFFSRIKQGEKTYMDAFNDELNAFKGRISARAEQKLAQAIKEYEEEERQKRLGPGGLDPQDVFESLPKNLQECFESRDTELLQKAIMELPREEAELHLDRCVKSGLWVPGGKDAEEGAQKEEQEQEEGEEVYVDAEDTVGELEAPKDSAESAPEQAKE